MICGSLAAKTLAATDKAAIPRMSLIFIVMVSRAGDAVPWAQKASYFSGE
jgi:hypothetical protein